MSTPHLPEMPGGLPGPDDIAGAVAAFAARFLAVPGAALTSMSPIAMGAGRPPVVVPGAPASSASAMSTPDMSATAMPTHSSGTPSPAAAASPTMPPTGGQPFAGAHVLQEACTCAPPLNASLRAAHSRGSYYFLERP